MNITFDNLSNKVIGLAIEVHRKLGTGLLGGTAGFFLGIFLARLLLGEAEDTEGIRTFWIGVPTIIVGTILGVLVAMGIDSKLGANYTLSPTELNVTLRKIGEKPQPNFILIDAEQFQNIKWIRIKCADSGGEEIVNLD